MKIINLTPHEVTLVGENNKVIGRFAPTGQIARVKTIAKEVGRVEMNGHSVPIVSTEFGKVENLPEPEGDTLYVVSLIVAQAVRGLRDDVVAPDTGPESVVRNSQGQIKGVRRFTR